MELPPALVYLASWVTVTGGVWALFERAENVASARMKTQIANWLRNLHSPGARNWPSMFADVFDHVFGSRHLSRRCFLRSAVASFLSILIVVLIWGGARPDEWTAFVAKEGVGALAILFAVGATVNVFPDYVSLLETRWAIKRMTGCGPLGITLLLLVDLAASAAIFLVPYATFIVLISYLADGDPAAASLQRIANDLPEYLLPLRAKQGSAPDGVFFYSTFFTSVWVWLYASAGFVLKATESLRAGASRLQAWFDVDEKPLRSIGFVATILITAAYVLTWPFVMK